MFEPVKWSYKKLNDKYKNNKNIETINSAVSKDGGLKEFYCVEEIFPADSWMSGVSTLDKNRCIAGIPYQKKIIQTVNINDIIKQRNIKNVNLLAIDSEAYDLEIIKSIDFDKTKPSVILYEHEHIDNNKAKEYLSKNGYDCCDVQIENKYNQQCTDTLAILNRGQDA